MASLVLCAPPALVLRLSWMSSAPLARLVFTATALAGCWRLEAQRCRELGSCEHVLSLLWLCLLCPASWIPAGTSTPPGLLALPPLPLPFAACGTALLLLTLLNGLGPYLGYKTAATWAMFSNLHVEGGWTNHRLVPASWQLCGMAADLVTVVDSDVELIRDYHTHSCFGATFEGNDVSPLQARAPSRGEDEWPTLTSGGRPQPASPHLAGLCAAVWHPLRLSRQLGAGPRRRRVCRLAIPRALLAAPQADLARGSAYAARLPRRVHSDERAGCAARRGGGGERRQGPRRATTSLRGARRKDRWRFGQAACRAAVLAAGEADLLQVSAPGGP